MKTQPNSKARRNRARPASKPRSSARRTRDVALLELLEALARATNEAATPEAAMRTCLERILAYGKWDFGRVATLAPGSRRPAIASSIWLSATRKRYSSFVRVSESYDYSDLSGTFVSVTLKEKRPVWLADFARSSPEGRLRTAIEAGLRSGLAFPIIVQGEAAAFLEFFSAKVHKPDPLLLDALGSIGAQLARLIERARAETAHANLAAIVEGSHDAILSRALDGTVLSWNAGAERMFGYSAAEMIGRNISIISPPELANEARRNTAALLRGEPAPPFETTRLTKDGRALRVQISVSPIRDARGNVAGVASIFRDVTERANAAAALEAAARLAHLMESLARAASEAATPEAALRACLEHICAYGRWSLGHVALYAPGHSSGVAQTSLWHARDATPHEELIRQSDAFAFNVRRGGFVGEALTDRRPVWVEDLTREANFGRMAALKQAGLRAGFVFPVIVGGAVAAFLEFFAAEARAPDRRLLEAIGAVSGQLARLIERQRAEVERIRLAAIVEHSGDAIVSTAPDRRIVTWNAGAERMFGYTGAEAVGRDVEFLVPEDLRHEIGQRRAFALAGRAAPPHDTVRLTKDGRRVPVSISASPLRDAGGNVTGVALIYRDISDRKRAEREIERGARISQLMESLARAANEANTPEAAMRACVERICDHGNWTMGRVALLPPAASKVPVSSLWHGASDERYTAFIRASDTFDFARPAGIFISHMLRAREPIWVPDLQAAPLSGRLIAAAKAGLRAGFAFPVTVQSEIVAFLEFFAEDVREPDQGLLGAIGNVSSQLARLIERARALDAMQASEERFRAAFEQAGVGMGLRSADPRNPRWLRVNQKLCEILGYTREELLELTTVDLTPPEDRQQAIDYNEKLMSGEVESYTREKQYLRKDGTTIWASVTLSAVKGADKRPTHIVSVITDISDRKRAEAAQARLAAIVENSADAIIGRSLGRSILSWNAAAERLFGWTAAEAIGKHISIIVPPERLGENARNREMVHRGEPVPPFDTQRLTKDGRRIDVSMSQSPIKDAGGRIVGVSLIFRDIADRKEAEEKIRYLAHYDGLTGLPNRALFYDRLGQAIAVARRNQHSVALLYLDLDGFKAVNDTFGHEAGDELLKGVAERMRNCLRESDTIARVGGDEFIAVLPKVAHRQDCAVVADKLIKALRLPFRLGHPPRDATVGVSIGIAAFPSDAEEMEPLVNAADAAMYRAKEPGNQYRFSGEDEAP